MKIKKTVKQVGDGGEIYGHPTPNIDKIILILFEGGPWLHGRRLAY